LGIVEDGGLAVALGQLPQQDAVCGVPMRAKVGEMGTIDPTSESAPEILDRAVGAVGAEKVMASGGGDHGEATRIAAAVRRRLLLGEFGFWMEMSMPRPKGVNEWVAGSIRFRLVARRNLIPGRSHSLTP
jgi:hypothetical protein